MLWARLQDMMEIWDGSPSPIYNPFWRLILKVKASICIALGWELRGSCWDGHDHIPVWGSEPSTYQDSYGYGQNWTEVAVDHRLFHWTYSRYRNGF